MSQHEQSFFHFVTLDRFHASVRVTPPLGSVEQESGLMGFVGLGLSRIQRRGNNVRLLCLPDN